MRRLAGVTLIAGSLLFFVGAVTPVNSRVFGTDDPLLKLLYIERDPARGTWRYVPRLGRSHRSYRSGAARKVGAADHGSSDSRSHRLWSRDACDRRRGIVDHHQLRPYRAVAL